MSPHRRLVAQLAPLAIAGAALTFAVAQASGARILRLDASLVARADSALTVLTAVLVIVVGLRAATPCGRWWEVALDRHKRRRFEGRPGEQGSP